MELSEIVSKVYDAIESGSISDLSNVAKEDEKGTILAFRRVLRDSQDKHKILEACMTAAEADAVSPDLPLALFDDVFRTTRVDDLRSEWTFFESFEARFSVEKFMPRTKNSKSKLALLRIANYILDRVPTSDSQLSGRILLFNARCFALSERSGVNLTSLYSERKVIFDRDSSNALYVALWSVVERTKTRKPSVDDFAAVRGSLETLHAYLSSRFPLTGPILEPLVHPYFGDEDLFPLQIAQDAFVYVVAVHVATWLSSLEASHGVDSEDLRVAAENFVGLLDEADKKRLRREKRWETWKIQDKCASFERTPPSADDLAGCVESATERASSDRSARSKLESIATKNARAWAPLFSSDDDVKTHCAGVAAPSIENFVRRMIDAVQPDAGIDAEYHPSKDDAYAWRGRRLVVAHELGSLRAMEVSALKTFENFARTKCGMSVETVPDVELRTKDDENETTNDEKKIDDAPEGVKVPDDDQTSPTGNEDADGRSAGTGQDDVEEGPSEKQDNATKAESEKPKARRNRKRKSTTTAKESVEEKGTKRSRREAA